MVYTMVTCKPPMAPYTPCTSVGKRKKLFETQRLRISCLNVTIDTFNTDVYNVVYINETSIET